MNVKWSISQISVPTPVCILKTFNSLFVFVSVFIIRVDAIANEFTSGQLHALATTTGIVEQLLSDIENNPGLFFSTEKFPELLNT